MKLLYISEIVGKCGIWSVKTCLPKLKLQYNPDYVIANGNSVTGAGGISRQHAGYLRKLGVDCISLGDNAFLNPQVFDTKPLNYCIRPINLSSSVTGFGYKAFYKDQTKKQEAVFDKSPDLVVASLLGQYGRHRILANDAFTSLDYIIKKYPESPIFVDYASFSTGEKQVLKYYADGKVSVIIGSGMKVATSDERISENGTAYISDAGRTGSFFSSGGYESENKIREFKTGLTEYSVCSWEEPQLQGVFLELKKNKVTNIEKILVKDYGNTGESS